MNISSADVPKQRCPTARIGITTVLLLESMYNERRPPRESDMHEIPIVQARVAMSTTFYALVE